jgi:hypothetical protein
MGGSDEERRMLDSAQVDPVEAEGAAPPLEGDDDGSLEELSLRRPVCHVPAFSYTYRSCASVIY